MKRKSAPAHDRTPIVETRLARVAEELPGRRILATTVGYAPAAHRLAAERFDARVVCWLLDVCQTTRAKACDLASPRTELVCQPDCPPFTCDLGLVPLYANGPAELTRDLLQQVFQQLDIGGHLVVAVDNRRDRSIRQYIGDLSKSMKCIEFEDSLVYVVTKLKPLRKLKDFRCQLAFRDRGALLQLLTRPGVFSHRQLDNGARQLIDAVTEVPQGAVLDLGCGSGAAGMAIARRDPSVHVVALDSQTRAVECAARGAELNHLSNLSAVSACADDWKPTQQFALALANPPYYGNDRLAEVFMRAAHKALCRSGQVIVVSKHPEWYEKNMSRWFVDCQVRPSRRYFIATGRRL